MDSNTCTDAGDLKVKELLKEVRLDWSSASTKLVDDTISAIKEAIDNIPEDLKVNFFSDTLVFTLHDLEIDFSPLIVEHRRLRLMLLRDLSEA